MSRQPLSLLAGAAVAASLAACGGGTTTVHSNALEGQIASEVQRHTGLHVTVVCPEPITQTTVGTTFVCKATTAQGLPFTVTMENTPNNSSKIVKITKG